MGKIIPFPNRRKQYYRDAVQVASIEQVMQWIAAEDDNEWFEEEEMI